MAEDEDGASGNSNSTSNKRNSGVESYSKSIDRLVLLHFFMLFGVGFVLGLLFLHSSLTFWRFQVYEESGYFENNILQDTTVQQGKAVNNDVISVVTYNANSSFSLVR